MPRRFRLFLSSPGDVATERGIVEEVVRRINDTHGEDGFDLYRWEAEHYSAVSTFQDQIPHASQSDLVICIFWKRLGSELPDDFARDDGSIPTGSEYEFEQAIEQATSSDDQLPDIYVYRSEEEVTFSQKTLELEKLQFDKLETFWKRWFRNERGHFTAAFDTYTDDDHFEDKIEAVLTDWLSKRQGSAIWTDGSPFRGLQPFEAKHAAIFFGRRRETARARARLMVLALAGKRFMLISGPSGSGKSSLMRAGLVPALARPGAGEVLPDQRIHVTTSPAQLCPDPDHAPDWSLPLAGILFADAALGAALRAGDYTTPQALADLLLTGKPACTPLRAALARIGKALTPARPVGLVLMIDQLEEIFAWPEADPFFDLLDALSSAAPGAHGITVIATMRSEFRHRLPQITALARLVQFAQVPGPDDPDPVLDITLPAPADVRDMIEGPVAAAGLTYAEATGDLPALASRIEAEASPGALPALQFLLTQLEMRKHGDTLTHEAFDDLGGVAGVMAHQGEEIIAREGEAQLPAILRALVKGGTPPTARRVRATVLNTDPAQARTVAALVNAGLIVSDGDTLRLAHESLITGWDRLKTIVDRESRLFDSRDRLAALTPRFVAGEIGHLQGFLLSEAEDLEAAWGPDLVAEAHPQLPAFIAASVRAARKARLRRIGAIAALGLVVLAVAVGFGLYQSNVVAERTRMLNWTASQYAIAESETATRDNKPGLALEFAIEADKTRPTAETVSLLMEKTLLLSSPGHLWTRTGGYDAVTWDAQDRLIAATADGRIVALTEDGPETLASLGALAPSATGAVSPNVILKLAALSDGSLAILTREALVAVIPADQLSGGSVEPQWIKDGTGAPRSMSSERAIFNKGSFALTPVDDGFAVAVLDGRENTVDLTRCAVPDAASCKTVTIETAILGEVDIAFAGDTLALSELPRLRLFGRNYDKGLGTSIIPSIFSLPNFDARRVRTEAIAANDTLISIYTSRFDDTGPGQEPDILTAMLNPFSLVRAQGFNPDRRLFGTYVRMSAAGLSNGTSPLQLVTFADNTVALKRLGRTDLRNVITLLKHPSPAVTEIIFAPDGDRFALRHQDGSVSLFSLAQMRRGGPLTRVPTASEAMAAVHVHPDGKVLFSGMTLESGASLVADDTGPLIAIATGPRGEIAGASGDGRIFLWPSKDTVTPTAIDPDVARAERFAYTLDGQLVFASADGLRTSDTAMKRPLDMRAVGGIAADPKTPGRVYFSDASGKLWRWDAGQGGPAPAVPEHNQADRTAGLSLAVDPGGRWLTSTRSDAQIFIYDLTEALPPRIAQIDTNDTKVVDFSPDGEHLAALSSAGVIYVWRFDAETGAATLLFSVDPMPLPVPYLTGVGRAVQWIDWKDNDHIAVATLHGEVLTLSIDADAWRARANRILPRAANIVTQEK